MSRQARQQERVRGAGRVQLDDAPILFTRREQKAPAPLSATAAALEPGSRAAAQTSVGTDAIADADTASVAKQSAKKSTAARRRSAVAECKPMDFTATPGKTPAKKRPRPGVLGVPRAALSTIVAAGVAAGDTSATLAGASVTAAAAAAGARSVSAAMMGREAKVKTPHRTRLTPLRRRLSVERGARTPLGSTGRRSDRARSLQTGVDEAGVAQNDLSAAQNKTATAVTIEQVELQAEPLDVDVDNSVSPAPIDCTNILEGVLDSPLPAASVPGRSPLVSRSTNTARRRADANASGDGGDIGDGDDGGNIAGRGRGAKSGKSGKGDRSAKHTLVQQQCTPISTPQNVAPRDQLVPLASPSEPTPRDARSGRGGRGGRAAAGAGGGGGGRRKLTRLERELGRGASRFDLTAPNFATPRKKSLPRQKTDEAVVRHGITVIRRERPRSEKISYKE